ncbi:MAG: ATP-grasp domain-containing protein, partial [Candidatus Levyibacteriota bacterium]
MKYIITSKGFISQNLTGLAELNDIKVLSDEALRKDSITLTAKDVVYIPSENALEAVLSHMGDKKTKLAVEILKDKYACRKILKSLFPSFYFRKISLHNLKDFPIPKKKKLVIKPAKGFFGAGVRIIDTKTNLTALQKDIAQEIAKYSAFYSESVLSKEELLIEEYITGEEYAVDMYYNKEGKPVIMNIFHHPIPKYSEYFNVLYYTNKKTFEKFHNKLVKFFTLLNKHLHAKSFAIHAEFKYTKNQLIPVEFNPLRFGGWGLADLTQYAFGINPFDAFFKNTSPDWNTIWKTKKDDYFCWVLAYNGKGVDIKKMQPNHAMFQKDLKTILHYNKLDYKKNPVFANAYIQVDKKT